MKLTELRALCDEQPLLPAAVTFRAYGMSSSTGYEAVRAGTFPIPPLHIGRKIVFRTADIRADLLREVTPL